jgi:hypothetical protein
MNISAIFARLHQELGWNDAALKFRFHLSDKVEDNI